MPLDQPPEARPCGRIDSGLGASAGVVLAFPAGTGN
jgi:hypothetical protein